MQVEYRSPGDTLVINHETPKSNSEVFSWHLEGAKCEVKPYTHVTHAVDPRGWVYGIQTHSSAPKA